MSGGATPKGADVATLPEDGIDRSRLASLSITGFRGIDQLQIPRLGRVALLAGQNGVGKTTVLEALRIYAARGGIDALREVLSCRDELTTFRDEDGDSVTAPALDRLFHQNGDDRVPVAIGPIGDEGKLKIDTVEDVSHLPDALIDTIEKEGARVLRVEFDDVRSFYPWSSSTWQERRLWRALQSREAESLPPLRCVSLGPGPLDNQDLVTLLDGVALTDDEDLAIEALRLVYRGVDGVAAIGTGRLHSRGRRVIVRRGNGAYPVPLRSLGDGATRMFGTSLALANCRDGILLIDEAENGIHYTLQSEFWSMVMCAAKANNTQVVATTHSRDCINGFATAALESPEINGNLIRIDRHRGKTYAVEYSKEELETAAEQNIEVR